MSNDEQNLRIVLATNLSDLQAADHDWDVYAQLRSVKELQTKSGKPYLVVELAALHGVVEGKIWDNAPAAMAAKLLLEAKAEGLAKDGRGGEFRRKSTSSPRGGPAAR